MSCKPPSYDKESYLWSRERSRNFYVYVIFYTFWSLIISCYYCRSLFFVKEVQKVEGISPLFYDTAFFSTVFINFLIRPNFLVLLEAISAINRTELSALPEDEPRAVEIDPLKKKFIDFEDEQLVTSLVYW